MRQLIEMQWVPEREMGKKKKGNEMGEATNPRSKGLTAKKKT